MRIVDSSEHDIINPDLTKGHLIDRLVIKKDAVKIDNKTKFIYEQDDYELVKMYIEWEEGEKELLDHAASLPSFDEIAESQESVDIAICDMYEENLRNVSVIEKQDVAICELYEMVIAGR